MKWWKFWTVAVLCLVLLLTPMWLALVITEAGQ